MCYLPLRSQRTVFADEKDEELFFRAGFRVDIDENVLSVLPGAFKLVAEHLI